MKPTMREKLIELLRDAFVSRPLHGGYNYIANHLIANGVTFATDNNVGDKLTPTADNLSATARWIPVEEALPETIACAAGTAYSEAVIVWTDGKKALTAVWNGETFLCDADYWEAWDEHITHWMPLPRPLPEVPQP